MNLSAQLPRPDIVQGQTQIDMANQALRAVASLIHEVANARGAEPSEGLSQTEPGDLSTLLDLIIREFEAGSRVIDAARRLMRDETSGPRVAPNKKAA